MTDPLGIAHVLCATTRTVLWQRHRDRVRSRLPQAVLQVRVGRGKATYCQRRDQRFVINFGVRMVAEKCDPRCAFKWLTATEIIRRGYRDGEVSARHLLAHTVCHEFAHLVQQANDWCRRGSVHNAAFYRILDGMYHDGTMGEVTDHIRRGCERTGIPAPDHIVMDALEREPPVQVAVRVGERVRFKGRDRVVTGRVRRINRRTVTVVPEQPSSRGVYYRVPFELLVPV